MPRKVDVAEALRKRLQELEIQHTKITEELRAHRKALKAFEARPIKKGRRRHK